MVLFCDGFDWPFGDEVARQTSVGLPDPWYDANKFGRYYNLAKAGDPPIMAFHPGGDFNLPQNADAHKPLYAMANGVVTFAGLWPSGSWGSLVIIRHTWPDGTRVYSRTAHVEKVIVKAGQDVVRGQQICAVGDANGRWSHHLHADISPTEVLGANPGHWTGANEALMLANYVPPIEYIQKHRPKGTGVPMPEPTATTLYVQPPGGVRLRTLPSTSAAIIRVAPQNERVEGYEAQQGGNVFWRRVTTANRDGWMGERLGAEIYLAPTPVTPPPIPTGATPYPPISIWLHHPSAANIPALLNALPESVGAIFLKTSDGPRWQGQSGGATAIDVNGKEDVDKWVKTAAIGKIDFHAWCVLQGEDVDGESQRLIDVANVEGVKSIILDIEPYNNFWKGPAANVAAIMTRVRANIPEGFHIGLSIDPRPAGSVRIYPEEWRRFVNSVHPQCYWTTFQQTPLDVLRNAYNAWIPYGLPIIPVLQGAAPSDEIRLAIDTVNATYKAQSFSVWRFGPDVMNAAQLAAIGDVAEPPPVIPVRMIVNTKVLNRRSGPGVTFKVITPAATEGNELLTSGKVMGPGPDNTIIPWTQIVSAAGMPSGVWVGWEYLRTPVIVVPKRDYWVWSTPHSSVRSEPDTSALIVGKAIRGEKFAIEEVGIENDTWVWGKIADGPNAGRFIALHGIGGSPKLLDTISPPIIVPPPQTAKVKLGAHVHLDKDLSKVYQFIEAYQPISVTVISDIPLIRWMVEHKYVKYPIFRQVWGPSDSQPEHVGDESDIERGKRFFYEGYDQGMNLWWWNKQCPHGTILQLNNETNSWKMGWWNIGLMQAGDQAGYKVIIDNTGVGQWANAVVNGQLVRPLYFDEQGNPRSDIVPGTNKTLMEHVFIGWRYAQEHGHFVGKHEYGNEEDGQHRWPGSPVGLPYYGRRLHSFLKMMPKPWPNVIINEFGSGKTERQKDMGFESTWNGIKEYLPLLNELENVLCANLWTHGDVAGHLGFRGASVDEWTDQMIARRNELPRPA